ncbi:MAG TPA: hypothetical protein VEC99_18845, partial [Clostridia bacterium]|nr:hypothetical protein [Clostridia bacterium]
YPVSHAFRAFHTVAGLRIRVVTEGEVPAKLAVLASKSLETGRAIVLIANHKSPASEIKLELAGVPNGSSYLVRTITTESAWKESVQGQITSDRKNLRLRLPAPGVALVELQKK